MSHEATKLVAIFLVLNLVIFAESQPAPAPEPATPTATCPRNAIQLRVCVDVSSIIGVNIGVSGECCPVLTGLLDREIVACLCTKVQVNVLGLYNMTLPLNIPSITDTCKVNPGDDYQCP
ncbi:OLC1v1031852C1 [Oldenlandia corymbosa var. corymbosa]|uniref:OLC1v1031852C1 n=1 Tax=Oldenlandia corymbosa var. corymbosa TaxID=529605 RepID=A0AAV1CJU7_OLDCO|nr:OLC1v1031852C1 [Oldenlandia corymbosa var. corymbosa]